MNRRLRSLLLNILFIILCVVVAYGISSYMFTSIKVEGVSMENTLIDGDKVLIYKIGDYERGDVVVFNTHEMGPNGERHLVKRIIGLPGDTIEIIRDDLDGRYYVYRNNKKLQEEYINKDHPMDNEMGRITVREGEFFYLGDNRGLSYDSRAGQRGKLDSIVGRVMLRYQINGKDWDINLIKRIK